jgi:putative phosphoesterase
MQKIGLISDTHGFFDDRLYAHLEGCSEVWHAGDIGNLETAQKIASFKPLKAVYGNIDGQDIRSQYPKNQRFLCENVDVWLTHIGGYPNRYDVAVRDSIHNDPPDLFISGHSHILKVMYDKNLELLHINPGSCGKYGFHKVRTAIRFTIDGKNIKDLEVIELGKK